MNDKNTTKPVEGKVEDKAKIAAEIEAKDSLASKQKAAEQGTKVAGSPVTAGTESSTDASGASNATIGNQSKTVVGGAATGDLMKDDEDLHDDDKSKVKPTMPNPPPAVDTVTAPNTTTNDGSPAKDPNHDSKVQDAIAEKVGAEIAPEIEDKDKDPPETLSDAEADALDAQFNGDTGDKAFTTEHSTDEDRLKWQGSSARIKKLVDLLAHERDEFIIYGYGGVSLKLGDLREVIIPYNYVDDQD